MDRDDFLGSLPPAIDLRSKDRWGAIDELLDHLVASNTIKTKDREPIALALKQREEAMSTGVGFEIGLPHASTDQVSDVVVAVGRSRSGIQFGALDARLVRLVVLFLVPTGQLQMHADTLATIAKLLHREEFREKLRRRFM